MGSLCAGEEKIDDIVTTEITQDGTAVEHRRALQKESKLFVRKTKTMLSVIIPELKRILHDKEEADMLRQIIAVLDKVALHYHEEFNPEERQKLLLMCCPERELRFRAILETFKPGEKIRQSRADVDLMRIIRLWFESDKDNSGELNISEVGQLLNTLGISINQRELKALFNKVDTSGDGSVQFDEFYSLYTDATTIPVVRDIFAAISTRRPGAREIFLEDGRLVLDMTIDPSLYRAKAALTAKEIEAMQVEGHIASADFNAASGQDNAFGSLGTSDFSKGGTSIGGAAAAASAGGPSNPTSPAVGGISPGAAPPLPGMEGHGPAIMGDAAGSPGGGQTPPPGSAGQPPLGTPQAAPIHTAGGGSTQQTPSQAALAAGAGGASAGQRTPQAGASGQQTPQVGAAASAAAAGPIDEKERARLEKEEEKARKKREKEEKKKKKKKKGEEAAEENVVEVGVLAFPDASRFLREVQQMDFDPDAGAFVVSNFFGEMRTIDGILGVAPRQFQNALVDPVRNSWFNPKEDLVTQDMSQPMSHYFVDSSFNTYLTGNQLSSPPSSEMFREALREGCRYIEMDVWNGPDGEPIVCLNPQAPRTITFEESVKAIAENAFYTTPYPVIIALEIHADEKQQEVMVGHLRANLGDAMILAADMEKTQLTSPNFSPAKLLRRFLVKTKKISELVIEQALDEEFLDTDKVSAMAQRAQRGSSMSKVCAIEQRRFRSLGACKKWPHYSLVSFDETKMENFLEKDNIEEIAEISKNIFIRSFPKGLRYDSSNQNPMKAWCMGAQVVAMNYQTLDYGFRLNRARFSMNGHCGYVLKPRCLRLPGVTPNLYGDRMRLTVEIVCGVQLPRSLKVKKGETEIPDPYVEMWITGVPQDDTSQQPYKTDFVSNNTFNPKWNETFHFVIQSVDMAILTVRVMDNDIHAIIAEGVCPVAGLRMGYRAIPLVAENGVAIPAPTSLFCKFEMSEIGRRIDDDDL